MSDNDDRYGGSGSSGGYGPSGPEYGQPPTHSGYGQSPPPYGQPPTHSGYGQSPPPPSYGGQGSGGYGAPPQYPGGYPTYGQPETGGSQGWSAIAIVGAALCWIPCLGLVSIVLGIIALATLRGRRGKWLGIASIVVPIVITAGLITLLVLAFQPAERNAAGEITESGTLEFQETRRGDCLSIDGLKEQEISESGLRGVPCSETHNAQVAGVADVSDQGEAYPGERALLGLANTRCAAEGVAPPAGYMPFSLYPTESVWDDDVDNRVVLCMLVKPDYADFSGDLVN